MSGAESSPLWAHVDYADAEAFGTATAFPLPAQHSAHQGPGFSAEPVPAVSHKLQYLRAFSA